MARYFLESSAFIKRYKREFGTDFVNSLFGNAHELFYLNLAIVEIRKVFYRLWKYPQNLQGDIQITNLVNAARQFVPEESIAIPENF